MDREKKVDHNVLVSLPTCLIHCILSDWVEVESVIRLDVVLAGSHKFHSQMLEILKSDQFYITKVKQVKYSPPKCANSRMLSWLTLRQVKVLSLELHEKCVTKELELYLQKYGRHVQRAHPNDDLNQHDRRISKQSFLFAKYCSNLSYFVYHGCTYIRDDSIWRTLSNNAHLECLDLYGTLMQIRDFSCHPECTLSSLKRLKYGETFELGSCLPILVKQAPNLQVLSIYCNPNKCMATDDVILEVAKGCPQLRAFSCKELHLGSRDQFLKSFLTTCSGIVMLSLYRHPGLKDGVLIAALMELKSLDSLDLRGCCQLTDKTLQFLTLRFAGTLKALSLDHSRYPRYYHEDEDDLEEVEEEAEEKEIDSGYTAAGIATLRAQCTQLNTFYYAIEVGTPAQPQNIEVFQHATIVNVGGMGDEVVPLILKHCHKMQVLAMSYDDYTSKLVWLPVDQLMTIAAHFPQLRVVVSERRNYNYKEEVDYSAVMKAFPKLAVTDNMAVAIFDVLKMSV